MDTQVDARERALGLSLCLVRQRGQVLYWTQSAVTLGPSLTAGLCHCPCPHLPAAPRGRQPPPPKLTEEGSPTPGGGSGPGFLETRCQVDLPLLTCLIALWRKLQSGFPGPRPLASLTEQGPACPSLGHTSMYSLLFSCLQDRHPFPEPLGFPRIPGLCWTREMETTLEP